MSVETNKAVVRRFLEDLVSTGNIALADDLLGDSFVLHYPGFPPQGIEGFKYLLPMFRAAFPDLRITVEELVGEGDMVAARLSWRGTHQGEFQGLPPTGRTVAVTGLGLYRLAGGKIVEDWIQEDFLGLMQQLGAIPAPSQATA
jgi:steroid delta-isomerase-like uncharacterized protein